MCGLHSIYELYKFDARINTLRKQIESDFDLLINRDFWIEDHNG